MKTKAILALLFCISIATQAQLKIGVRGNLSGSTVTKFDLIENITPTFRISPSASAALFLEIPVTNKISFQPEVAYTIKGFIIKEGIDVAGKFVGVDIPINGRVNFKLHYVDVPLLAKFHFGDKNGVHSYLLLGPSVGILADANMRIRVFNIFPINSNIPTGMFNKAELSGVAALGFEAPITEKISFFTEARYQHGFSRIFDTPIVQLPVRNRTYSAGAGLKISI